VAGSNRPTGPRRGGGVRSATGVDPSTGLRSLVDRVQRAREAAIPALAIALVREITITLSQPGRGRVYLRNHVRRAAGGRFRSTTTGRFANRTSFFSLDVAGRVHDVRGRFAAKHGKNRHVASAPGDPPAVDTGNLRGSISWEWVGRNARVGTNVDYAPGLELGTLGHGGHIAPRPFMRPSVERLKALVPQILRDAHADVPVIGRHGAVRPRRNGRNAGDGGDA
jgi:phage gpG-like protein